MHMCTTGIIMTTKAFLLLLMDSVSALHDYVGGNNKLSFT